MDAKLISIIGAALAVAIGSIAPALAEGRAVAAAMDAIARQPEAAGTISRTLFVGLAMIETMAIYCLVIALILLFANPYAGEPAIWLVHSGVADDQLRDPGVAAESVSL